MGRFCSPVSRWRVRAMVRMTPRCWGRSRSYRQRMQSTAHRWESSTSSAWISQPLIPARALLTPPSGDARKILRERSSREEFGRSATRQERAQRVYDVEAVRAVRAASRGRLARRVPPHREVRFRDTRLLEAAIRIATLINAVVVSAERPECVRRLPPQAAPTTPAARRGELDVRQSRRRSARGRRGGPRLIDAGR
jgi:hypothetical protein